MHYISNVQNHLRGESLFSHTFSILVINRSLQVNWEYYKVDWLSMVRNPCKNIYQRANHDAKFFCFTFIMFSKYLIVAFYILKASRCMLVLLGYLIPHRYLLSSSSLVRNINSEKLLIELLLLMLALQLERVHVYERLMFPCLN